MERTDFSGARPQQPELPKAMVSIRDVSIAAGVSIATVSRAIGNPDRVSKATREKVLSVVDALGYSPNLVARSLRSQQSKLIIVLVTNIVRLSL